MNGFNNKYNHCRRNSLSVYKLNYFPSINQSVKADFLGNYHTKKPALIFVYIRSYHFYQTNMFQWSSKQHTHDLCSITHSTDFRLHRISRVIRSARRIYINLLFWFNSVQLAIADLTVVSIFSRIQFTIT